MENSTTEQLARSANALLQAGYVLLPVRDKTPMTEYKPDNAGIRTPDEVAFWLGQGADGFAVLTRHSGVAVVDLDVKPAQVDGSGDVNGLAWWGSHALPLSPMIGFTRSGGAHLYFRRRADGQSLRQSAGVIAPGVDTRGDNTNGYVVAVGYGRTLSAVVPVAELPEIPDAVLALLPPEAPRLSADAIAPPVGETSRFSEWAAQRAPQRLSAAWAAVERELTAASAPAAPGSGYRDTLMKAAFTLGGYVAAGVLDGDAAAQRLFEAATAAWGVGNDDDRRWIHQGLTDGQRHPFAVYDDRHAGQPGAPTDLSPRAAASLAHVRQFGLLPEVFDPVEDNTHQGLAEAVLAELYPNLRMDMESGSWLARGPERWFTLSRDASGWAVAEVARRMPFGVRPVPKDPQERTAEHWQAHRHQMFHSGPASAPVAKKIRDVVSGTRHASHVRLSELDADPAILWAGGRPWDLRTCALADADPLTPHTHSARFEPVEGPTPLWDAFTAAVWPDAEIREWALQVLAVGLTGHSPRVMPVLYGDTGRGKTQVVALLCNLLGTYGGPADQKLIVAPEAHGSVVYSLKGLRLAYIDEPAPTHRDKVERVKLLTGGGRMTGNQMRKDPVTWDSTHTLALMQNDAPELTDDALRDRARVIACDGDPEAVSAARAALGEVSGDSYSAAWAKEAPGVLAAMMRRAARWLADPGVLDQRRTPAAVAEMVEAMVREQDPLQQWMAERTDPAVPGTPASTLHNDFAVWFRNHAVFGRRAVLSAVDFGRRLTRAGVGTTKGRESNLRHLVLRQAGGTWFTGPAPVPAVGTPIGRSASGAEDGGGSVEDASASSSTPNTQVNPSIFTPVEGVEGVLPVSESSLLNPLSTYSPYIGTSTTHPPQKCAQSAPDQRIQAVEDDSGNLPQPPLAPVRAKRTRRQPGEPTPAQARRAAERSAKAAELAGPLLELPVVVRRLTPTPRHVEHVHVGPLLADALAKSRGHLTVDVETTGYPIGHPLYALRTIQVGTRVLAVDLDADCVECRSLATAAIARADVLHAHNANADVPPLHHAGVADHHDLWAKMEDTVLPAKLADPTSAGGDPGLKAASAAVLPATGPDRAMSPTADEARSALFAAAGWLKDTEPTTPEAKSGWLQADKRCAAMQVYACSDVLDGAMLALELPAPDPAVHEREKRLQRIVAPAATFGFPLDRELVLQRHDEHDAGEKRLRQQVCDTLGVANPGSPKQLGDAFQRMGAQLPLTPSGAPSTAKDAMAALSETPGPAQAAARLVLDWRHHDTALKLILRPWRIAVLQGDGRVRPTVYTLGADTGRMSCVRPNMQQISKKGGIRECVLADDGMMIVSADFQGVELRVAAALSGDPVLRSALEQGVDIHRMVAAQAFGEALADDNRTLAKRIVFGHIYGGGFETLAKQSGVPVATVAACVDALQAITPGLAAWSEEIKRRIRSGDRQFRTYSGRVIHLDPKLPHKGPNYLIQGTARELLADALIGWDGSAFGGGTLMPVHDEIVAMVPADHANEGLATLMRHMTNRLGDIAITAEAGGPPSRSWHSG